jgi:hypothetical protein
MGCTDTEEDRIFPYGYHFRRPESSIVSVVYIGLILMYLQPSRVTLLIFL